MGNPLVVVVGAGPGVSGSVAKRFGRAGYDVGLIGLSLEELTVLGEGLQAQGINAGWTDADVTDSAGLTAAVERLAGYAGHVEALHFNPSAYRAKTPLELTAAELLEDVALGVGALLTAVQAVRPYMSAGGRVTATGSVAADRPAYTAASLGVQKAALRNLVLSLDRTLEPDGIRAVSVTVDGVIDREDTSSPLHPDAIADAILSAATRPEESWRPEVRHPAG
jgi:NADP-dependent 3-hydroxy acid dehydrogenase YdfG